MNASSFFLLLWKLRPARFPLVWEPTQRSSRMRHAVLASLVMGLVLLVVAIVATPIPISRVSFVTTQAVCQRDIMMVLDVSGSMDKKLEEALSAIHKFAKDRPGDCFGLTIFSGPGESSNETGSAFVVHDSIRDPDELIFPLREGAGGPLRFGTLAQFKSGTRVSEGLRVTGEFFQNKTRSSPNVLVLISDLGTEDKDIEKTIAVTERLLNEDVHMYVLGVDVAESNSLLPELKPLLRERYRPINEDKNFTAAYDFINSVEPTPAVFEETRTENVEVPNRILYLAALLVICIPWVVSRLKRRTI